MKNILKLKNIEKSFGEHKVINKVTAFFRTEQITALIGPNGAGKTTLFHLITGELIPESGDIIYKDSVITGMPTYKIARLGIGKLFQDVRVFKKLSSLDNIIVALQKPRDESIYNIFLNPKISEETRKKYLKKAKETLEFIGLEGLEEKNAENLSYGQQKLLAIGRLLAGDFELYLLDEPTAGINPNMVEKILGLLVKMVEELKKTIVIVEHDMKVVQDISYWVHFMNEGRIAFSGRKDHVLGAKEVRKLYLGLPERE